MPAEVNRKMSKKKITNPKDTSQYVEVPIIDEITFIDETDRFQEIRFSFFNKPQDNADREVRTVRVKDSTGAPGYVDVERIDMFQTSDATDRGQEHIYTPDNKTGEDAKPKPHFSTHVKTHVKRLKANRGSGYIDTERIDEITFKDPIDRAQETRFILDKSQWGDE